MKHINDLEQTVRELPVEVDPAMDDRILGRATAALAREPRATADRPSNTSKGIFFMIRNWTRFAAAAAILIAAVVMYNVLQPKDHPVGAAFADVLQSAAKARTVTYKQVIRMPGYPEYKSEQMLMEPGYRRYSLSGWFMHDSITIQDRNRGISLSLIPSMKKAELHRALNLPERERLGNCFDELQRMHQDSGRFVRQETLDGKTVNVYLVEKLFKKTTIWTDPATNLAVRMETHEWPNPKYSGEPPCIDIHHAYFGGGSDAVSPVRASDAAGIQRETTVTRTDFVWDANLDPSLFDVTPPADYQVEERQYDAADESQDQLVAALRFWAEVSDGAFPDGIRTLLQAEPKIAKRFRGQPDALDQALRTAGFIVDGVLFAEERKVEDKFHYAGHAVKLGQADKPVCWWKLEDGKSCRVIYGDLAIRDVPAEQMNGIAESPEVQPVVHTVRYKQAGILDGNKAAAARSTVMLMEPGYQRIDNHGSSMITDFAVAIQLDLLTKEKVAYLHDFDRPPGQASQPVTDVASRVRRQGCHNPLQELATLYLRGTLQGQQELNGRTVDVYEYSNPDRKEHGTVWLDPAAKLLVQVERVVMIEDRQAKSGGKTDGGDAPASQPVQRELKYVLSDFEWDVPLDRGLFSVEVPEGYTLKQE